jgi:hypothetical protein
MSSRVDISLMKSASFSISVIFVSMYCPVNGKIPTYKNLNGECQLF